MGPTASEKAGRGFQFLAKTCDSPLLNEIMPMIYKRFTEKAAEEWRQIYKVRTSRLALVTHIQTTI